ncbi:hypothetical protein LCGC14_0987360, partial [marine sediment metagenome]
MLQVEEHLRSYPCPFCLRKHLLDAEAHLEEIVPMAEGEEQDTFIGLLERVREIRKSIEAENLACPPCPEHGPLEQATNGGVLYQDEACDQVPGKYRHLAPFFSSPYVESVLEQPGDRGRRIDEILARLEAGVKEIHESDNYRRFMATMAKFHRYSLGNIMLISIQRPDAVRVAGFARWKELGRSVRKGEKGIAILAPCFPPKAKPVEPPPEEEDEGEPEPVYFKTVYVFDIRQTEGKELPVVEVPIISGEETRPLYQRAVAFAASKGIRVSREPQPQVSADTMGYWDRRAKVAWVRPDVPQEQATKTLLHEVAHGLSEQDPSVSYAEAETIAEGVAFTVAAHFGFDTGIRSFPYVALWAGDIKVLRRNLAAIHRLAKSMIDGLEVAAMEATVVTALPPEEEHPYARPRPKAITIYPDTIEKHYVDKEVFHPGSFRVVEPLPGVQVYLGCKKEDRWDASAVRCYPNPTVHLTIVPRTAEYMA